MLQYFLDAVDQIEKGQPVSYWTECKILELGMLLSVQDKGDLIHHIITRNQVANVFRYFARGQALAGIFPYLQALRYVPQNKGKSKNAFEHTIKVIAVVPHDNVVLRWAALFHDLGKYDTYRQTSKFIGHEKYSEKIAEGNCRLYSIANEPKICSIVKNHMSPLNYQRDPHWSDEAIKRFIGRCGVEHAIDTVEFSYYDKKAENDVPDYLRIIEEFKAKVKRIIDNGNK